MGDDFAALLEHLDIVGNLLVQQAAVGDHNDGVEQRRIHSLCPNCIPARMRGLSFSGPGMFMVKHKSVCPYSLSSACCRRKRLSRASIISCTVTSMQCLFLKNSKALKSAFCCFQFVEIRCQ